MNRNLVTASVFLASVLMHVSCLKENPASDLTGSGSLSSGLTFNQALSSESQSAYVLDVSNWQLAEDGRSFFRHLTSDDYFGLEIFSSAGPIDDLRVQLTKSTTEFVNFLGLDGSFGTQSLDIKLPLSMFFSGMLLTANSSPNPYDFEYKFRMADSDIEVDIDYVIDADDAVTVTVTDRGSIIMRRLMPQSLTITGPGPLPYRHYNDQDVSLRTFTWPNANGAPTQCSLDGGANWKACSTATSLVLTPAEFNTYPDIMVKVSGDNGLLQGSIDLSDDSAGYNHVTIHTCELPIINANPPPGDLGAILLSGRSATSVVCLAGGNYSASSDILFDEKTNIKVIGDHRSPVVISSSASNHAFNMYENSELPTDYVIANLKISYAGVGNAVYLAKNITDPTIAAYSDTIFSNVEIELTASLAKAIHLLPGQKLKMYNSKIHSNMVQSTGIYNAGSEIYLIDSEIDITADSYPAIEFKGSYQNSFRSFIVNSVISTRSTTNPPIYIWKDGGPTLPSNFEIIDSRISSANFALKFFASPGYQVRIENTVFRRLNTNSSSFAAIYAPSELYNLTGNANTFCAENNAGFLFTGALSDSGANNTGSFQMVSSPVCPAP